MRDKLRIVNDIKDFINKNDINKLKDYIKNENIEIKRIDKDIENYTNKLYNKGKISNELNYFVKIHYDKNIVNFIEIIKKNDLEKLKNYLLKNNVKLYDINYKYFDIMKYSIFLMERKEISSDIYTYIKNHFNRIKVIEIMKKNNVNELRSFSMKNNIEFKELNDNTFDIINYINSPKNKISDDIKKFVIETFVFKRKNIIKYLKEENVIDLKKYIKNNKIEIKDLNDENFDIIDYVNSSTNSISFKMKNFVISHYNKERFEIIELISNNDINYLKEYIEKNSIELEKLNDENFDILNFINKNIEISESMKIFVISHLNKKRYDIVELIRENNLTKLKNYVEKNNIEFKSFEDSYFNIIKYSFHLYNYNIIFCNVKDYIITRYTKQRRLIINMIKKNDINGLKGYIEKNSIELEKLNDENFDILKYINKNIKISKSMKIFVISHLNKKRYDIVELIRENNLTKLKNYVEKNNIEFKSFEDSSFNIIKYSFYFYGCKTISCDVRDYVITGYTRQRRLIINMIKKNDFNGQKKYIIENNVKIDELNGYNFNIVKYTCDYLYNISSKVTELIKDFYYKRGFSIPICLIKENKLNQLKEYTEKNNFIFESLNTNNFNIIEYILTLYQQNLISLEMKNFIIYHYNEKRKMIVKLFEKNNINELKEYSEK
ncbi:hypothetical protein BCR32DRAFT_301294 [Anaeromyces robustus]|uniref:Uncharacterized protein n=1 Tax=Anaeromyces robustus TaxID=1754192 RepID=A0A1Y1X0P6_9FUNG|nr:hypothetical protein BCR32DRAFT_301294 [Anaeromyces robustus]|eukprot:ORX78986.1 hypothetical protein BCR32DRAFT_301294 [Anaeromyces robustus]